MHQYRFAFTFLAWTCFSCLSVTPAFAVISGTIEFVDSAPPPSDQEIQTAKSYEARAAYLADTIQRLSTAMTATQSLLDSFEAATGTDSSDPTPAVNDWQTSWSTLVPNTAVDQPIVLGDGEIGKYIKQTIMLTGKIKSLRSDDRPTELHSQAASTLAIQSLIVDHMLAEHGQLNRALRYYPMSAIAHQAPLGCDQIAVFSRDFRCYSKSANPGLPPDQWCDITDSAQTYSVAEWSNGTVMVVRMASFTDHTLPKGLVGQLIANAHSTASLRPKC